MIRIFNHYLSLRLVVLTAIEALVLFQSVVLGFHLRMLVDSAPLPLTEAVIFTAVMLGMMTSLGLYQSQVEPFRNTLQRLFIAYGLALLVMSYRRVQQDRRTTDDRHAGEHAAER